MKTGIILLLQFFGCFLSLHAQVNYKPGFIVLTSGDTIFTKIKYLPEYEMCTKLYYLDEEGKEKLMPIINTAMYNRDGVIYRKFRVGVIEERYYKLIKTGSLNLYACFLAVGYSNAYSYNKANDKTFFIVEKGYLKSEPIRKLHEWEYLKSFISDDPEALALFQSDPKHNNAMEVIELYNQNHAKE